MKTDVEKTDVIFRKETRDTKWENEIFALFPYDVHDFFSGHCASYQHIGQHSPADYDMCIQNSIPAKGDEYKDLKSELESLGYNLNIIKKRNYQKYLIALRDSRQS